MADQRARNLSRELELDGSIQAAARILVERLRVGAVRPERAWLAGYLGHGPAALAVGVVPHAVGNDLRFLEEWLQGFASVGREAWVRAALAVTRAARDELRRIGRAQTRSLRSAIGAACAWAECPCDEHARQARILPIGDRPDPQDPVATAHEAATACLRAIGEPDPGQHALLALQRGHAVATLVSQEAVERRRHRALRRREGRFTWHEGQRLGLVVDAVRDELIPWLLAERDPIAGELSNPLPLGAQAQRS